MAILAPFLTERSYQGRWVRTAKGALAKELQEQFGDVLMNSDDETIHAIEIKIEARWTGRLFLETWSNRNLERRASHAERGSKPGWLVTQRADILMYYFLDTDILLALPLFRLQQWAFGAGSDAGFIYRYPELRQGKYDQLNDTWGRCVPVDSIEKALRVRRISVKQLPLDLDDAA